MKGWKVLCIVLLLFAVATSVVVSQVFWNETFSFVVNAAPSQYTPARQQAGLAIFDPPMGAVGAVAIDPARPEVIYAGAYDGLFRSMDGGESWHLLSTGLRYPREILIDPTTPGVLYACRYPLAHETGTAVPGIYRSTDGGVTWTVKGDGTRGREIYSLALDPHSPATLYAGSREGLVLKSTDAGQTWAPAGEERPALEGLPPRTVIGLEVHPRTGALYAVEEQMGVFKSTDGGRTWATIHRGSGYLAIDPHSDTLYLAGRALWRSGDGGETWMDVSGDLPLHRKTLSHLLTWVGVQADPPVLYAQWYHLLTFRSTDGGATWTALDVEGRFLPREIQAGPHPTLYGSVKGTLGRYVDETGP
jgi:photosystem II stability/assembly factor-like uncharacterized protein